MSNSNEKTVKRIRPDKVFMTKQKVPYYNGISDKTTGAEAISMNVIVVPPGGKGEPHYHRGFEAAIYQLEGKVETRFGEGLKESIVSEKGDLLFIPPGVPHQPINLSDTERAVAIVSRSDPSEQENVVLYKVEE